MSIMASKSHSFRRSLVFAISFTPLVSANSYISLTDMSQYSDLPSDVQNYATIVIRGYYYPACSFTPTRSEISTAACFKATPSVASSLLHNVLKDPGQFWDPNQPTEARTSVENLLTNWWNQAAVTALAATKDGGAPATSSSLPITAPTATTSASSDSGSSSKQSSTGQSNSSGAQSGWAGLPSVAQVFTILGPIITITVFILGVLLERRRRRNNRARASGEQQRMELNNQGHQAVNGRMNGEIGNAVIGNRNQTGNHTTNFGDHYYMNDGQDQRPAQARIARKPIQSRQDSIQVEERSLDTNSLTTASTSRNHSERRSGQVRDV